MEDNDKKIVLFYTDEDVNGKAIKIARNMGVELVTANEAGLSGEDDPAHFKYAIEHDYVIVTRNVKHFSPLHYQWIAAGNNHPGMILVTGNRGKNAMSLAHAMLDIQKTHTPDSFRNHVEWV